MAISSSSNLCSGLASALPARGPFLPATFGVTTLEAATTFGGTAFGTSAFGASHLGAAAFGASFVVAAFTTRAMSPTPFHVVDGACELTGLSFETCHPFRVLPSFGLGKLANYPTVQASHVVETHPYRQIFGHIVVHAGRGSRPRSSNQVLFLRGLTRQLGLE